MPASTQTDICNMALTIVGATTINAISDISPQAVTLNAIWNMIYRKELRSHWWKFSIQRGNLSQLSQAPASGPYNTAFAIPTGSLRVIQVGTIWAAADLSDYRSGESSADWSVEGGQILSNQSSSGVDSPLSVRYIVDVPDCTQWDTCFQEAVAAALAYAACFRLTNSMEMQGAAGNAYKQALKDAVAANALESTPKFPADDTWMMARFG